MVLIVIWIILTPKCVPPHIIDIGQLFIRSRWFLKISIFAYYAILFAYIYFYIKQKTYFYFIFWSWNLSWQISKSEDTLKDIEFFMYLHLENQIFYLAPIELIELNKSERYRITIFRYEYKTNKPTFRAFFKNMYKKTSKSVKIDFKNWGYTINS